MHFPGLAPLAWIVFRCVYKQISPATPAPLSSILREHRAELDFANLLHVVLHGVPGGLSQWHSKGLHVCFWVCCTFGEQLKKQMRSTSSP